MSDPYDPSSQERPDGAAHSRFGRTVRAALIVLAYVALYLALNWLSVKFQTDPAAISSFYPAHGLTLALLLLFGLRYAPALVLGPVIIYLTTRPAGPVNWYLVGVPLIPALGYGLAALVLKRVLRIDPYLRRLRDVNWFALVSVLASGVVATLAGLEFAWANATHGLTFGRFVAIWWVGDAVGIATLAPFLLITVAPWARDLARGKPAVEIEPARASEKRDWSKIELAAQVASIVFVLWFVFGWRSATDSHRYYVCFLPLTWIVLRHGRHGASVAVLAINLGVLFAVRGLQLGFIDLANILLFLEVLSVSGLVLGAVVHERRQAEQALRRGEERYRAYIQQRSEGIARFENERPVLIDLHEDEQVKLLLRNSYLAECNNVQAKMYGFGGSEEMLGFRLTDSIDRSKPANIENLRAFIRSGYRLEDVESLEFDRHGNTRYFLNSAIGIVENGALVRFWSTQLDITERKRAEEAQRISEERFSRVFNASPLPMTISTLKDGRIIDVNVAYLRGSGFTRAEVIGRTSAELNIWPAPEDRSRFMDLLNGDGAISNVEVTFRGRNGNLLTTLLSADIIELDGEQCVLIVANDITQRKRAEEALRKSEIRLASAQQLAHIGSWESDLATGQLYWSDETYKILGLDPDTPATAEMFWNAIHPKDKTALRRLISETLLKGKVYSVDNRIVRPDGSERVVHAQGEAVLDKDGLVVRLVGSVQDITERKRMEDALIESEARFRHVFESNMLGIGYSGAGGVITDANDLLVKILGCSRQEIAAGKINWRDITPPEYAAADQKAMEEMGRTGMTRPYEKEYFRRDGSRVPILIGAALLGGYTDRAVFFVLDITESKRAEQALRESEQLHRMLFERNLAGVYRSAFDGWILECNDSLARILGYESAEELRSRPVTDLYYDPADRGKFLERLSEHGVITDLEWCMRRRDGSPVWVIENTSLIREADGEFSIQGTLIDITARKRAEEALRESEAIFRTLADTIAAGIFIYRGERFIYANAAAQTITGYSLEELLSINMLDTVHPDHREMVSGFARARQKGEQAPSQYELRIVTKMGEEKWADMTASLINHQGQPAGMITAFDLTYRKKAEEALRESERRLRAVLEHLPAMVAGLDDSSAPVFFNRECERVTGYTQEEMLGNTKCLKLLLPDQDYRREVLAEHARRAGEYRDMETQIVCKDGSIRTLAWSNISGRVGIEGWTNWGIGLDVTTRKQVDEALRKAEEKYRSIFENAVEGIYQSSPSGQFITANPALARILGYQSPAELIHDLTDLHDGQYVEPGRRVQFRRLLEEQPSLVGFENQSYRKDGGRIWISENARAVRNSSGELLYYEGSMEDVTDRKRAEQRQAIQFAVTRVLAESATLEDAIPELLGFICTEFEWQTGLLWLVDADSSVLRLDTEWRIGQGDEAPQASCLQTALAPGESLSGSVWLNQAPVWYPDPSIDPPCCDAPERAAEKKGSCGFPIPVGGEIFGVMEFHSPEVGERDDALLKMMADIASRIGQFVERKRAEDEQARLQSAIRSAAIEWQLTFDAIESPVLVLDPGGRVRRLNRAAQSLAGKAEGDCIGKEVGQLHSGEPWQRITESIELVRKEGAAISCQVLDQRNGRSWDIVASPFLAPGERDDWVIAVARDVSGMAELQESLRRSQTMSAMGSLVAGVAHEVRNPLFGISATLDAFDARFGEREEFLQYTKVLRGELDRLGRLMQDLLDYGKPASLNLSEGRLDAVVAEALQICAPVAERSRVHIESKLDAGLRSVRMDQRRLVQVFQNLLENAVHHSPAGGVVTVDAEEVTIDQRGWIECSIKDSGNGFLVEDLPRLFEPFFTKRRGGTGLGLSIVQRIVEQHGGHVSAANRPGGGALIVLTFPAQ